MILYQVWFLVAVDGQPLDGRVSKPINVTKFNSMVSSEWRAANVRANETVPVDYLLQLLVTDVVFMSDWTSISRALTTVVQATSQGTTEMCILHKLCEPMQRKRTVKELASLHRPTKAAMNISINISAGVFHVSCNLFKLSVE